MTEDPEVLRRLGSTLRDKWKLNRVLGVGGMAAVYVGQHKIGREDAIKILHPDVARSKNVRARFEQEAHAVNRFKHPGVVEIRDIDTAEDGAPFLVMELLIGESLSARAKRLGSIEQPEVLRIADELLDVLAAAHAQGIIHRDIKPDNLFILEDGRLKVLDFGIARMREGAPKTMHTRVGSTLGTVAYMPPEQTMGSKIDERADLFSVGATMFRLLTRRYIHQADSEMELLVKMASDPAPPLASIAPSVPRDICLVVDRALAFERARRYPDARTMQSDVRAVRAGAPPPYATERLRVDGPPSTVSTGAAVSGAASAPGAAGAADLRDTPTVVPGGAAGAAPVSAHTVPSLSGSPRSSDEQFGMADTAWSMEAAPPYAPGAVRIAGASFESPSGVGVPSQPISSARPASFAAPGSAPSPLSPRAPLGSAPSLPPYSVSVPPSSARPGGAPSSTPPREYTPVLARASSHSPSLSERLSKIDRKILVLAAALFSLLLFGLVLWLALGSSDDTASEDSDTRSSNPGEGKGSDPSRYGPSQTEDSSPGEYRGKSKGRRKGHKR